jgi:UDP-3-O-acyl-N-acetylglucosamine deacetylase
LVGDLALTGCDVHGHLVAHRSGHQLNAELVRALLRQHLDNSHGVESRAPRRRIA